jgi:hypothetical protein
VAQLAGGAQLVGGAGVEVYLGHYQNLFSHG